MTPEAPARKIFIAAPFVEPYDETGDSSVTGMRRSGKSDDDWIRGVTNLATQQFDELRPLMFSIAYRMLGSVTEAEDIIQEAFIRMYGPDAGEARSPEALATTVTTRLAIDHLRS